ncbi:hypothetical protein J6590_102719 [Homalodisca vitripennis]|nr:hypothetical protein J6590_102719 [Homalodisca vitripennis]
MFTQVRGIEKVLPNGTIRGLEMSWASGISKNPNKNGGHPSSSVKLHHHKVAGRQTDTCADAAIVAHIPTEPTSTVSA